MSNRSPNRPTGPARTPQQDRGRTEVEPREWAYFEGEGEAASIRPQLLDEEAKELAQQLKDMAKTQLRRYYNEVLNLQRRLDVTSEKLGGPQHREDAFRKLRIDFLMLKAKAHYAHARSKKIFPRPLLEFFVNHTHSVKTARDFDAFCRHFQAVVAFHQYFGTKEEERT